LRIAGSNLSALLCLQNPCSMFFISFIYSPEFQTPEWWFLLFFCFVLGSVVGSFLNVLIHRLPLAESLFPSSHCPKCNSRIYFYDNIPILSWLILRGLCRNCRGAISVRYPLTEMLTGILYALLFWREGLNLLLPFSLFFGAAIVALIFIDAEHMYLPDAINFPCLLLAILARLLLPLVFHFAPFDDLNFLPLKQITHLPLWMVSLGGALLGALAGGGFLWLIGWLWRHLRGVEAMGLGDVKMMLWIGVFLGWRLTILSIFLAALIGAFFGVLQILRQGSANLQTKIPFGIYLGSGSLLAQLCGAQLISWYLDVFLPN
jgi:leader peptidase (prepilin peptidase)/N-methyltransferase